MVKPKRLGVATLVAIGLVALAITSTVGFLTRALPVSGATMIGFSAIGLSIASFVLSIRLKSGIISSLLIASGVIIMIPPIMAILATRMIIFPGPILGVISYSVILGLGIAKSISSGKMATKVAKTN